MLAAINKSMKPISLFFLLLTSLSSFCAEEKNIEQIAFDYLISKLDTIHYLCLNNNKFDTIHSNLFVDKFSNNRSRIFTTRLKYPPFDTFISTDSTNLKTMDEETYIACSENVAEFDFKKYSFVKVNDNLSKNDSLNENDFTVICSSKFVLYSYYIVRISIACPKNYIQNDFYIKIDLNGTPISYIRSMGMR